MKGNSVSIKGNLTRNAEIRGTSGDRACVAFGLAWNNNYLRADNTPLDQPHYFEVSCWMSAGQQDYFLPRLTKGTACSIIDGYLSYHTWTTKDGEKRSRVEIAVTDPFSSMTLLAPRKRRFERRAMGAEAGNTVDSVSGTDGNADAGNNTGADLVSYGDTEVAINNEAGSVADADAATASENDAQVPLAGNDNEAEEFAIDSQASVTPQAPAAEIACDPESVFDLEELSPEDIFGAVAVETPTDIAIEGNPEPVPDNKGGKNSKPESPSSKKRATA